MLLLMTLLTFAFAADEDGLEVDPITGLPIVRDLDLDDDDDLDIALPPPPQPEKTGPPVLTLDPGTAEPLTAAVPGSVVAVGTGTVVVEVPVFVARARKPQETGLMVIGEFMLGTTKVGEVRQVFEPTSILEAQPTWAFFKAVVPATTPTGTVTVVVKTAAKDGKSPTERFRTNVSWTL